MSLDQQIIAEIVRGATVEVFEMMLGLSIECGEHAVEQAMSRESTGMVGLVGFAGRWVGMGALAFSQEAGILFASQFLGHELTAIDDEVLDSVAEMTNMILGNVKNGLERHVGDLALSVPTVIYGERFRAHSAQRGEWLAVRFRCEGHGITVRVFLAERSDRAVPLPAGALSLAM